MTFHNDHYKYAEKPKDEVFQPYMSTTRIYTLSLLLILCMLLLFPVNDEECKQATHAILFFFYQQLVRI